MTSNVRFKIRKYIRFNKQIIYRWFLEYDSLNIDCLKWLNVL